MKVLKARSMILISMMSNLTTYVFQFHDDTSVTRIPFAKWKRIREGEERVKEYANGKMYIAYAYILLENRKPDYCPIIEGSIYYFDAMGYVIKTLTRIDLLRELYEKDDDAIDFNYHRQKVDYFKKHQWQLNSSQIQEVIKMIW